ncbi:restriction endonuclease subunit S [Streptomyces sp. NPDC002785]|uniref:restriction endonuclease subunit S n=1 Tax=Streptomyces sp. NPDC002785 TaxID=3154543 RepID=UPI00332B0E5D
MTVTHKRLGDVASFVRGITFKPTDVVPNGTTSSVWCMRTKNVQAQVDLSDVWSVDSGFVKRSEQYLEEGDVLISSANSWNLVGKCCWIPRLDKSTSFGGFVTALRGDVSQVNRRYLYRWFSSARIQETVRSFSRQTTNIANLDLKRCADLPVPLPQLAEQKRIASVLDQVDALRAQRRKAIALLDDLVRSTFLDMFGALQQDWREVHVADLAVSEKGSIRTGPFGSQLLHEEFTDEGVAVLGIDNAVKNEFRWGERRYISEEKYQELARYTVYPGDLLITIMGTCGRSAVVPDDIPVSINTKHLCCITLDRAKCLPEFLHSYFLEHPESRSYLSKVAKGAIMSGLNMGLIKSLPVRLPPLEVQEEYVGRVAGIRKSRMLHERHLATLDELFESVQQRAFAGQLWDHEAA